MSSVEPNDIIEKLKAALADSDGKTPHIFDDEEVAILQSLIRFMKRLQALGWLGRYLFIAIVGLATLWANWDAIMDKIKGGS